MNYVIYTALIEKDGDSYGVTFPDLDGCVSVGDSFEEAVAGATEALAAHLAMAADNDFPIQAPTAFKDVKTDNNTEVNVVAKIPVMAKIPARAVRINITVDANALELIDIAAEKAGVSRSGYLVFAAMEKAENKTYSSINSPVSVD